MIREFKNVERFFFWKKRQLKKKIMKNEKTRYSYDSIDKYKKYLIFRFFEMKRNTRLTSKRLRRIRINEKLFKKKLLIKMLFQKKICLIWNFSKIKRIRSKIISSLKIKISFHKTWQISDFSIFKLLNDIVS